jgi:serine/threonine protein kinase
VNLVERSRSLEQSLLGQTLAGKYKLLDVQASGAFGVVFRAEQYFCRQRVRPVAVKVSRQSDLSEDTAPYLFGDALILAQLLATTATGIDDAGCRHLVQIHDMGLLLEHDNRAFLVMEYVDGLPLLSHMRAAGRFSVSLGLRFLKQICRGMALVHGQGAVHRDLKSDNILVDRRGVLRIVDFGLAAYTDRRHGFAAGSLGTFTYMAPETLLGRSTPASDVYSLGLLMYELFTGGGPHLSVPWTLDDKKDRRDEHLRLKRALHFPPPSTVQNEIRNDHRWLDAVVARCLEVEPERRFADAGRLLAALEACDAGQPLPPSESTGETPGSPTPGSPTPGSPTPGSPTPGTPTPGTPTLAAEDEVDTLFREVRRLLAARAYEQAIDRLDVHRPPEWAVLDVTGAKTLRALGQAYLGAGNLPAARDCLEQLRATRKEQDLLPRAEYAAALSDLYKCYRGLGQMEAARACQEEARQLL